MRAKTLDPLMGTLAELSRLYPEMRLGQVIEMVAVLSDEESPAGPAEIEDDELLKAAAEHVRIRRQQLQMEAEAAGRGPLPDSRAELLGELERVRERRPDWRLGYLVEQLATSAGSNLYDAEDERLIAAARGFIGPG